MSLKDLTDPKAVVAAIEEFDQLGKDGFLDKYGFGVAKDYFVVYDDKNYDSKAIAGAAHGNQHGVPLGKDDFSGGDATVATQLEKLGFTVTRPESLPDWSNDELILALDLYLATRGAMGYGKTTKEVVDLSNLLRALVIFPSHVRQNPKFRNPSGVALKLHNFEAIDPSHQGAGMPHGSQADQRTWDLWAQRPDELKAVAVAIRAIGTSPDAAIDTGEDEEGGSEEGRALYRMHRHLERDRSLVARKKKSVLAQTGRLACEVCDFESSEIYGAEARGVIDVHHVAPLYVMGVSTTKLADLALVCPTCHRVVHRHSPLITPGQLRAMRSTL